MIMKNSTNYQEYDECPFEHVHSLTNVMMLKYTFTLAVWNFWLAQKNTVFFIINYFHCITKSIVIMKRKPGKVK